LLIVGILIAAAGAAIWPFAGIQGLSTFPAEWRNLVHVQQTASILRILFFLVLAGCSQLLSIGWRDRELQVATGLGFYSIISVAVAVLHSRQGMGQEYRNLNRFVAVSYLGSLVYWVVSFAQQEAERREFSPQMRSALLAAAGAARTTRVALTDSTPNKTRKR
jgi:ABC-type transport system involved in cytochrome c biogenesis permease subunit